MARVDENQGQVARAADGDLHSGPFPAREVESTEIKAKTGKETAVQEEIQILLTFLEKKSSPWKFLCLWTPSQSR